eukprot:TRINITY_DN14252_c0_g1_i1.p1 TRINITY_DN14252_c0_g1~~TRINITY_DN14252_c0_g1_i1.p1  ORF type:complete len:565 (-),score=118.44 TRINITY_DN14252_c0_g1_i1:112-1806(-)
MLAAELALEDAISVLRKRQLLRSSSTPDVVRQSSAAARSRAFESGVPNGQARLSRSTPWPSGGTPKKQHSPKTPNSESSRTVNSPGDSAWPLDHTVMLHESFDRDMAVLESLVAGPVPEQLAALLRPNSAGKLTKQKRVSRSNTQAGKWQQRQRSAADAWISEKPSRRKHPERISRCHVCPGNSDRPDTSAAPVVLPRSLSSPLSNSRVRSKASPLSASGSPKITSKHLLGRLGAAGDRHFELAKQPASPFEAGCSEAGKGVQRPSSAAQGRTARRSSAQPFEPLREIKPQQMGREAAAAFHNIDLNPPPARIPTPRVEEDEDEKPGPPPPPPVPPGARGLANELKIPLCDMMEAVRLFRQHAEFPDGDDNLDTAILRMDRFDDVLCTMCNVASLEQLSSEFVEGARKTADRDGGGSIDVREFSVWYNAYSFSEEVTLSPEGKETRRLAKKFQLDSASIDRYKLYFAKHADENNIIDFDRFSVLINEILKIPVGHEIFPNRLQSMWRMADADGGGELDFEEFCVFYLKMFENDAAEGSNAVLDFYRNVRKIPVAPSLSDTLSQK